MARKRSAHLRSLSERLARPDLLALPGRQDPRDRQARRDQMARLDLLAPLAPSDLRDPLDPKDRQGRRESKVFRVYRESPGPEELESSPPVAALLYRRASRVFWSNCTVPGAVVAEGETALAAPEAARGHTPALS